MNHDERFRIFCNTGSNFILQGKRHVIVRVYVSVFTIKRPKGTSATRARGLLIVKTVNKCTLSSLVSDLVFDRQTYNSARRPNQATPISHVYQGV